MNVYIYIYVQYVHGGDLNIIMFNLIWREKD